MILTVLSILASDTEYFLAGVFGGVLGSLICTLIQQEKRQHIHKPIIKKDHYATKVRKKQESSFV